MGTNNQTEGGDEFVPMGDDDFSADEQAAIERMQAETPMPTKNEGGDPPAEGAGETTDGKPGPTEQADAPEGEADLQEGEEEITVDGQGRAHDRDGKFVSKSALLRVKEQNKSVRAELESERAARAKLEGRLDILTEIINAGPGPDGKSAAAKQQPANPWDEQDVDPVSDIFGAFEQQKRRNAYERAQREALVSGQGHRDKQTATLNAYVADAKRLAAENIKNGELVTVGEGANARQIPAMQAAYFHVVAMRNAQLEALGVTDKAKRDAQIAMEEGTLVEESLAANKSPAETIVAVAKAMGFKMPAKAAASANGKDTGKTPAQLEAEKKLEQVNKAKASSQTLSGKGGQSYGGVTPAQITNMDDAAFDAFVSKMGGDEAFMRKMFGAD